MKSISKNKISTIIVLMMTWLIVSLQYSTAQTWQWGTTMGNNYSSPGSDPDEKVNDIAVDEQGNVYVCGEILYDGLISGQQVTCYAWWAYTGFIAKYSCNGDLIWAKTYGSPNDARATAIELDGAGNLYLTGRFSITPAPGYELHFLDTVVSANIYDLFIAKLDTAGNRIWLKIGNPNNTYPSVSFPLSMDLDYSGNINILFGSIKDVEIFTGYQITKGTYSLKMDPQGNIINLLPVSSDAYTGILWDIAHDQNGDWYLATYSGRDTIQIGGQLFFDVDTVPTNYYWLFIKLNAMNQVQWYKQFGDTVFYGEAYGVMVDANNDVYLSASMKTNYVWEGHVFNNPLASSYIIQFPFIAKFNSAGTLLWATSPHVQYHSNAKGNIALDKYNNIYMSGRFAGQAQFGNTSLYGTNINNLYLCKVDSTGTLSYGTTFPSTGSIIDPVVTKTDTSGNVYVGGSFSNSFTINGVTYTNPGGNSDGFIAKYGYGCSTGLWEDLINDDHFPLAIYPNPANEKVTVSGLPPDERVELVVTDVSGRVVSSITSNTPQLTIVVKNYAAGLYFVTATGKHGMKTVKLVKE